MVPLKLFCCCLLLTVVAGLTHNSEESNDPSTKDVTICEGKEGELSCLSSKQILIINANYGRLSKDICPHSAVGNTNCRAASSQLRVKQSCDGKKKCSVKASNTVFGEPCGGTYKYLQVKYSCVNPEPSTKDVTICEGTEREITCPSSQELRIINANYGRVSKDICPHSAVANTNCRAASSQIEVKQSCDGKRKCSLKSSNTVFGDPCGGTYKYLQVKYSCVKTGTRMMK